MTDWQIVQPGDGANPSLVAPERTYVLRPGDAHFYDVGVVHSPRRDGLTKLVRIEGANLDQTLEHQGSLTAATYSPALAPAPHSH